MLSNVSGMDSPRSCTGADVSSHQPKLPLICIQIGFRCIQETKRIPLASFPFAILPDKMDGHIEGSGRQNSKSSFDFARTTARHIVGVEKFGKEKKKIKKEEIKKE